MQRAIIFIFLVLVLSGAALAQSQPLYLGRKTSDPATCSPTLGQWYFNTTSRVFKWCSATNVWTSIGTGGTFTGGTVSSPISFANGSAGAPSVAFSNSNTTGIFRPAANSIGFSIAGTEKVTIDPRGRLYLGGDKTFRATDDEPICVLCMGNTTDTYADTIDTYNKYNIDIEPSVTVDNLAENIGIFTKVQGRTSTSGTITGGYFSTYSWGNKKDTHNGNLTMYGVRASSYVRSQNEDAAYGGYFEVLSGGNFGSTNTTPFYGVVGKVYPGHNGTMPLAVGGQFIVSNIGGGGLGTTNMAIGVQSIIDGAPSLTNYDTAKGLALEGWTSASGGTWTNSYGIYADTSIDQGTRRYFIYSLSRSPSFFSAPLQVAQGSISTSQPFVDHSATWNAGSNVFQNIKSNVTNTASASTSTLLELQVGGTNKFGVRVDGSPLLDRTITSIGTTGSQTINKPAGTINIAASAGTATLTNSLIDANSIILPVIRTADSTCTSVKSVVASSGSAVFTMNANCTAATSIGFLVTN